MQSFPPDGPEQMFPAGDQPEEVVAGVWRIPVPLPFALRSANVYLIADGPADWTLVDCGLGLAADEAALQAGLTHAGVSLDAITALILTHGHPDHIGLAATVQHAADIPVYMLAGEETRMFTFWGDGSEDILARVGAMFAANGLSATEVASGLVSSRRMRTILRLPPRDSLHLLHPGEALRLGAHTWQTFWTPGHSDYHLCLLRDDGVFIAGDHVLPSITPNIGLYPDARIDPLHDYLDAVRQVRDLPVRIVLPGHGRPFIALPERADALGAHHRERSEEVQGVLREQHLGVSARALADHVFGPRLRNGDDVRFATVEMLAHLEYLRLSERALRRDDGPVITYHSPK